MHSGGETDKGCITFIPYAPNTYRPINLFEFRFNCLSHPQDKATRWISLTRMC